MKRKTNNSFNADFNFYRNMKNEKPIVKGLKSATIKDGDYIVTPFSNYDYDNYDSYVNLENGASLVKKVKPFTITENGTYNVNTINTVEVNVSGGDPPTPTPTEIKSVAVIRDYDGSVIASYTKEQFKALTDYPTQPTHTGLLGQGYNWTLENAKDYVDRYEYVEVGATYITDDGKTRFYTLVEYDGSSRGFDNIKLNGTAIIDWGDGSDPDTIVGDDIDTRIYSSHTYTNRGNYIITIDIIQGEALICRSEDGAFYTYHKIEIGNGITSIEEYAFYDSDDSSILNTITIPNNVTQIGASVFTSNTQLLATVLPRSITTISENLFNGCYKTLFISLPDTITAIGAYTFINCSLIKHLIIPRSVTSMGGSQHYDCLSGCYSLESYVITDNIDALGVSFYTPWSIKSIIIDNPNITFGFSDDANYTLTSAIFTDNITSINNNMLKFCEALQSVKIPDTVTVIGTAAFENCCSLVSVTLPSNLTTIASSAFDGCTALTSITIPEGVTLIGSDDTQHSSGAFEGCYSMTSLTFCSSTPPILGTDSFQNLNPNCIIYVPQDSLEAYTSDGRYPDPTIYTYIGY